MKLFWAFPIFLLLLPTAQASWYCGGWWGPCPSAYPVDCCVSGIPICLYEGTDCRQRCCIGGGCDSYDDFRFCWEGDVANCDTGTHPEWDYMVCCPEDHPEFNSDAEQCWKEDWECTKAHTELCPDGKPYCWEWDGDENKECVGCTEDGHCAEDAYCDVSGGPGTQHCSGVECEDDGEICTEDVIINHVCVHNWIDGCCHTDYHCENDETCNIDSNLCKPLICDDGDICTEDEAVEHKCVHNWIDGCCHTDDDCPIGLFCDLPNYWCEPVICEEEARVCTNETEASWLIGGEINKTVLGYAIEGHECVEFVIEQCNGTSICLEGECVELPWHVWHLETIIFASILATLLILLVIYFKVRK